MRPLRSPTQNLFLAGHAVTVLPRALTCVERNNSSDRLSLLGAIEPGEHKWPWNCHFGIEDVASALKEREVEILFFLVGSGRYVSDDRGYGVTNLALRKRWGVPSFVRLNDKPPRAIFTSDFRVLKKRDEILTTVRNAVKVQAMRGTAPCK